MLRTTIGYMADKAAWYLYRRSCMSVYRSNCLQADSLFPHAFPRVYDFVMRQQSDGGLGGFFTSMKLMELSRFLYYRKPPAIIEFGGGATTAVFAEYASETPGVRFVSIDESQYYQDLTRDRLDPGLRESVVFVHAERIERSWRQQSVCHYDHSQFPDLGTEPLMCYVDGPDTKPTGKTGKYKKLACVDVVMLAEVGLEIGDVLFDCRFASVSFARHSSEFNQHQARLHFRAAENRNDWALIDPHCYHTSLSKLENQSPRKGRKPTFVHSDCLL